MTLEEIKAAVGDGKTVCVGNEAYEVMHDKKCDQWLIHCTLNDHYIGLTWRDGVTMNDRPENFYIKGAIR